MDRNFDRGEDLDGTFILTIDFGVGLIVAIWSIANIVNNNWLVCSALSLMIVIGAYALMIWVIIYQYEKIYFSEYTDNVAGLITNGPYHMVRHPWYFADIMLIIASFPVSIPSTFFQPNHTLMVYFGFYLCLVFSLLGLIGIASRSSREECFLEQAFGNEYKKYKRKTNFLIPYLNLFP